MAQADWMESCLECLEGSWDPPRMPRLAWQLNFEWCAYSWADKDARDIRDWAAESCSLQPFHAHDEPARRRHTNPIAVYEIRVGRLAKALEGGSDRRYVSTAGRALQHLHLGRR
jgi:hypothetical protein